MTRTAGRKRVRGADDDPPGGIPGTYQGSEGLFFRRRWRSNLGGVGGYLFNCVEQLRHIDVNIRVGEFVPSDGGALPKSLPTAKMPAAVLETSGPK